MMKRIILLLLFLIGIPFVYGLSGNGTSGNPYLITNCTDLQDIKNYNLSRYFKLSSDIDCSDTKNWNGGLGFLPLPIFEGSFNGDGYFIFNLFIHRLVTHYVGLFSYVNNSNISNFIMDNVSFVGNNNVGGVAGYSRNSSFNKIAVINSDIESDYYSGCLIGFSSNEGSITSYINECFVNCSVFAKIFYEGGFLSYTGNLIINNSYSFANYNDSINGYGGSVICGLQNTPFNLTVHNSYSKGYNYNFGYGVGVDIKDTSLGNYFSINSYASNNSHNLINVLTSKNDTDLNKNSTFISWDFDNIWYIDEGVSSPILRWFKEIMEDDSPQQITGNGTKDNPYMIYTCQNFQNITDYGCDYVYYELNNSIDCSDFGEFESLCINKSHGSGDLNIHHGFNFNGNNHTVYNISLVGNIQHNWATTCSISLFGEHRMGEFKNVGFDGVEYVPVVAWTYGCSCSLLIGQTIKIGAGTYYVNISNIYIKNANNSGLNTSSVTRFAWFIGLSKDVNVYIDDCYVSDSYAHKPASNKEMITGFSQQWNKIYVNKTYSLGEYLNYPISVGYYPTTYLHIANSNYDAEYLNLSAGIGNNLTTRQMQVPSLNYWENFSSNIWNIPICAYPSLKWENLNYPLGDITIQNPSNDSTIEFNDNVTINISVYSAGLFCDCKAIINNNETDYKFSTESNNIYLYHFEDEEGLKQHNLTVSCSDGTKNDSIVFYTKELIGLTIIYPLDNSSISTEENITIYFMASVNYSNCLIKSSTINDTINVTKGNNYYNYIPIHGSNYFSVICIGGNDTSYFDVCIPLWYCSVYGECDVDFQPCINVSDSRGCGLSFTGSNLDYGRNCSEEGATYVSIEFPVTSFNSTKMFRNAPLNMTDVLFMFFIFAIALFMFTLGMNKNQWIFMMVGSLMFIFIGLTVFGVNQSFSLMIILVGTLLLYYSIWKKGRGR